MDMRQRTSVGRAAVVICILTAIALAASVLQGRSSAVTVGKSLADSLLPLPQRTVWAPCPDPDSYFDSYRDASGSGTNYVYEVNAADENGRDMTVDIILFGRKASGEGWIKIEAKGTSGLHYDSIAEDKVPQAAREALPTDSDL